MDEYLIPLTAAGVIFLNLVNRIVWDWLKNKWGNRQGNPSQNGGPYMRVEEHERLCNARLVSIYEKLDLIWTKVKGM